MPPIEDGQEEQRNQNWSPANGFGVGHGEFSLHYLKSIKGLWTLLIEKATKLRLELVIIECFLFFVKQIHIWVDFITIFETIFRVAWEVESEKDPR